MDLTVNAEALFDDWPDPVLLVDPSGLIQHANQPACWEFGYSHKQFVGLQIASVLPSRESERLHWMRENYRKDPHSAEHAMGSPLTCVSSNGRQFTASATFEAASATSGDWTWILLETNGWRSPVLTAPGVAEATSPDHAPTAESESRSAVPFVFASAGLGSSLSSILSLDSAFQQAARELRPRLNYNILGIIRIDAEAGMATMTQLAVDSASAIPGRSPGSVFPLIETVANKVLMTRAPVAVSVSDEASFRRLYPGSIPLNAPIDFLSGSAVPVFYGERVPGMVFALSNGPDTFGPNHVKILSEMAGTGLRQAT